MNAKAKVSPDHHACASNRKAFHDYEVLERLRAGVVLRGTEVKVLREGKASLAGSYASVDKTGYEVWLENVNIPIYSHGNLANHNPLRKRKLLLTRREILKLREHVEQKGNTLIPLELYFDDNNRLKCTLGVCRGKNEYDKRDALRKREADLEAKRARAATLRRNP